MITKRYLTGGINGVTNAYNNTTALVGHTTAFDRTGNKLYERHLEAESRSHLYQPFNSDGSFGVGYDSANRLLQYQRGVLSSATIPYLVSPGASISTPTTLPGADQVRTYGLDGLGNWKTSNFTEVGSGGSTTSTAETRAHNYVNEITGITDITGDTTTSTPFTYDKNGNLLNDGILSYQYDALNRLVNISNASTSALLASYAYDGLNRRIQKNIADLSGGFGGLTGDIPAGTSNYLYDGQQMAMDRDDEGGWAQAYFWGRYIDELLFFAVPTETVPTTYRVLSDLLYRSTALVDTSNNIVEAYDTDAYGNTLCYSGPGTDGLWFTDDDVRTNNPINTTIFTGRQYDPESQIYYYRARYYSPQIGRFISRDPLRYAQLLQGANLYWYARNNPITAVDYLGLCACCANEDRECVIITVAAINRIKEILSDRDTLIALFQLIAAEGGSIFDAGAKAIYEDLLADTGLKALGVDLLTLPVAAAEAINFTNEIQQQAQELASSKNALNFFQKEFDADVKSLPSVEAAVKKVNDALVNCIEINNDTWLDCKCSSYWDKYQEALQSLDNK